jgi:CheY-like chemotaxis protein
MDDPDRRSTCMLQNMDRYLSKPFTIEELFMMLEEYAGPAAPDPVATRGEAILDPRTLAGIRPMRKPGAPDLLAKVAAIYASNSRVLVDDIKSSLLGNDQTGLLRAVHTRNPAVPT